MDYLIFLKSFFSKFITSHNEPLNKMRVSNVNNHTTSKEYCNWHPTQKPISILERFIKAYTNPGDTVLDIFSGAASTLIACENLNRNFKGCEIDLEFYELSKARFAELTGKAI